MKSHWNGPDFSKIEISDWITADITSPEVLQTASVVGYTGNAITGESDGKRVQLYSPVGLYSIPPNAVIGKPSTKVLTLFGEDENIGFAGRDYANQSKVGNVKPGETVLYAPSSAAAVVLKIDGSSSLATTDANGVLVYHQVTPSKMQFSAPWGGMVFDASGFHVGDNTGARIDLGGCSIPAPLSALGTYVMLHASQISLDGQAICLGNSPVQTPIMTNVPALILALELITTTLTAIGATITTNGNLGSVTSGTFSASGAAITTASAAALAAVTALIAPSPAGISSATTVSG